MPKKRACPFAQFLDLPPTEGVVELVHGHQPTNIRGRVSGFEPCHRTLTALQAAGLPILGDQASKLLTRVARTLIRY